MKYINPQDVLVIHAKIIDETGGSHGVRGIHLLISATERPKVMFARKELYPDIFQKAAVLLESLAMNHPFIDGNKRSAISSMARFFDINNYALDVTSKDLVVFVLLVVEKKPSVEEITSWLKQHTKKKK